AFLVIACKSLYSARSARMSRRPAHQGFPDRRGPPDRDGRDHGSGGDAVLAYADRPWAAARDQVAVRVSAVRNEQGRSPLVRRVGLPGRGLSQPLACVSSPAALVPGGPPACAAPAQACAVLTAGLESTITSGADCAAGSGDAREHEAGEQRSHQAGQAPWRTASS